MPSDPKLPRLLPAFPAICDRIAPVFPKPALRNTDADRCLPAFILVDIYKANNPLNVDSLETFRNDRIGTEIPLYIKIQDLIEHVITGQAVLSF